MKINTFFIAILSISVASIAFSQNDYNYDREEESDTRAYVPTSEGGKLAVDQISPESQGTPRQFLTTATQDYGKFQDNDPNTNVLLLEPGDRSSVVSRYRSSYGNKYRVWIDSHGANYPINLENETSFRVFLDHFGEDESAGGDKGWCEIVENAWSGWAPQGAVPSACGTHTYTEERTCSTVGLADKPCPDSCPTATETRTATVTNADCGTAPVLTINAIPSGVEGSTFSPSFSYYDDDGDDVEIRWWAYDGCEAVSGVGFYYPASNTPVFRRIKDGNYERCRIRGRARDDQHTASSVYAYGDVVAGCDQNAWKAPDGGSVSDYADTCTIPGTFTSTNECGTTREDSCTAVACDADDWFAPGGGDIDDFASTCTIPGTFQIANACGDTSTASCTQAVCDPTSWTAPDGGDVNSYASSCESPNTFTITNQCGSTSTQACTGSPVCDPTSWTAPDGGSVSDYAANCLIPNEFTPVNACGVEGTMSCTGLRCDPNSWTAPGGGSVSSYASSCTVPNTFVATNECGSTRTHSCTGALPAVNGSITLDYQTNTGGISSWPSRSYSDSDDGELDMYVTASHPVTWSVVENGSYCEGTKYSRVLSSTVLMLSVEATDDGANAYHCYGRFNITARFSDGSTESGVVLLDSESQPNDDE